MTLWLERGLGFYFVYVYVHVCVWGGYGGQKPSPGVVSGANYLVYWDNAYYWNLAIVNCTSWLRSPEDQPVSTSLLLSFLKNKTKTTGSGFRFRVSCLHSTHINK